MFEERELMIRLKRDWTLAFRRSEDYPDGHPDKEMNAWLAEDIQRFIDILAAYQDDKDGIYYDMGQLYADTPFPSLKREIREHADRLRASEERQELVRSRYI